MEIIGNVYKILPQEEVTLGDGTKRMKGGFVIMPDGVYAKPVAFELFGDERLALLNGISVGMQVKAYFLAISFEGKKGGYYTSLRCTNVMPLVAATVSQSTQVGVAPNGADNGAWNPVAGAMPQNQPAVELSPEEALPFDDDLPFF